MNSLPLEARYTAAWGEIQTRIEQRQSLFTFYITIAIATIGLACGSDTDKGKADEKAIFLMQLAITASTLIVCVQLVMHELMIHNLHLFCQECENQPGSTGPKYHTDPAGGFSRSGDTDFFSLARFARKWNDAAWLLIFASANFASGYLSWKEPIDCCHCGAVLLPIITTAVASIFVFYIRSIRHPVGKGRCVGQETDRFAGSPNVSPAECPGTPVV